MPGFLYIYRVEDVKGIYNKGTIPERMRWLDWGARTAFDDIRGFAVVTDMFRSAESSLLAIKTKKGSLPPGFSAHGFGRAIDVDVDRSMKRAKTKTKKAFDELMASFRWYCHRSDHERDREDWHFNYLITPPKGKFSGDDVEREILDAYRHELALNKTQVQEGLQELRFYGGAVDGKHGPLTKQAITLFQRAWGLPQDGIAGPRTQRTLAYIAWGQNDGRML